MRYAVRHTTAYTYSEGATLGSNLAHLRLRPTPHQTVESSELAIEPAPDDRVERIDPFGNHQTYFSIEAPHDELVVTASSVVDVAAPAVPADAQAPWETARDDTLDPVAERPFVLPSRLVPRLAHVGRLADEHLLPGRPLADAVASLTMGIHRDWTYDPTATTVATPLADVVAARRGVCQDFAHLAVAALRSVGLPARYVSGYLETFPPPGQPKLVGADASHAWAAVRCPGGAWLDLDPTNDVLAPGTHVTAAWGRDYSDVVPLQGVVLAAGGTTSLHVEVDVHRLD